MALTLVEAAKLSTDVLQKYIIRTKNKMYNGVTEEVLFQNGQAIVEDEYLKNLLVANYGYTAKQIEDDTDKKKKGK